MDHQHSHFTVEHQELEIEMSETLNKAHCSCVCIFSRKENQPELERRTSSARKLCGLIVLYSLAMVIEIVGGIKSNSLAVLTDAAHMFSDIVGFAISLFAVWASGWKATAHQSYGFYRFEVLGALLSVQLIWLISGILMYEAIDRILHTSEIINGKVMFLVAAFGFLINLTMITWLGHSHLLHDHHHHHHCSSGGHDHDHVVDEEESVMLVSDSPHHHDHHSHHPCSNGGHDHEHDHEEVCDSESKTNKMNINLQGAYLHVVADLIQSIGVMISGAIIWARPNWVVIDLLCTSVFSVFVLLSTMSMLSTIFGILMERTPKEIDIVRLENGLKSVRGVSEVHDLHVWSITVGKIAMSCHVIIEPGVGSRQISFDIRQFCAKTYRINHVTVQIEQE